MRPIETGKPFPSRPVRIIEPFGAGGGPDVVARAVAERLSEMWGSPVIVENHPGAGSTAAPALVAESRADGHTLLINTSAHAYSAAVVTDLPYDPLRDFIPVAAVTSQPYVLVAGAWTGIGSVAALIDAARATPGELRFASTGVGTGTHLALEKLNQDAGITASHVPAERADAIADVIAGTVEGRTAYAMSPPQFAAAQLEDGGLVALGVSTARRSRLMPDVPTLAEAGVPGYDFPIWYGIWAPAWTSKEIVGKIHRDIADVLAIEELRDWLIGHDAEPMRMTQAEFAGFVVRESEEAARMLPRSCPR